MKANSQNSNINFLSEMKNTFSEIKSNCNGMNIYLNNIISSKDLKKIEEEFEKAIYNLSLCINTKKDLKEKQDCLDELKQTLKNYNEKILLIYENNYIKKIKELNQNLNDLMNKIIIEFDPPNINSFYNNIDINVSSNNNKINDNYSYGQYEPKTFNEEYSYFIKINNSKSQINGDNGQNNKIDYFCLVCSKEKAIYLCDKCNLLFCKGCFEFVIKYDNATNKCEHNPQKISDMKDQNEKGKILYLNSLNNFIKSILIKSNCLFKSEIIKSKSINDSKIEYIKRIFFKYPNMEKINNFDSEINFLKDINNILEKNFNIENLYSKDFCVSDMDKTLLNSIMNIFFKDNPNKYEYFRENEIDINEDEDDSDENIDNEIYMKEEEEKEVNSTKNMFYYLINLIPKKSISYNKKDITSFLIDGITSKIKIQKENIYLLFGEKNIFINNFIKAEKFSSMSLEEIKKNFLKEYKAIYEYKIIYEGLSILIDKNYLDCRGNTICPNSNHNLFRGIEKYYPPYGWIGIGLKVLDIYGDNNWLEDKTKSSKWAIAYLGIGQTLSSNKIKKVLKNIVIKRNFNNTIGKDIYLTPNIDNAEYFSGIISIYKKKYKVALMAKVLIREIKESKGIINYWILNQKYVRIYRILLKEI